MERICCACRVEHWDEEPIQFPLIKTAYPLGPACRRSWRAAALGLGKDINNPARVHMRFTAWLETRGVVA